LTQFLIPFTKKTLSGKIPFFVPITTATPILKIKTTTLKTSEPNSSMSEATKFYPPSKVNLIPHFSPFTPKTISPNSISLPPTPIRFIKMREKALKKGRQIIKNTSIKMPAKLRRGP
jgi:hypothetical protein